MSRRPVAALLASAVVLLLVARYAGGVHWGARAAVALVLGYAVLRVGLASLLPLRVRERSGPAADVALDGVPVYSCPTCGTQLVLLRQGTDKPPRHCGEAMRFEVVAEEPPAVGLL